MVSSPRFISSPPAKLSRQHSPGSINSTSSEVVTTPPPKLSRQYIPESITSTSVSTPPTKLSRQNSPRTISNTDTEYALQEAGTWNGVHSQSHHSGRRSVFEDVTIPTNILRYANIAKEWTPNIEATGTQDRHQADSKSAFNVVDIALEQKLVIDYALGNALESHAGFPSRKMNIWDHGQATNWRQTSLPTLSEEKRGGALGSRRRSTSGMQAAHATPRRLIDIQPGQDAVSAGHQMDNTILFRSLNSYAFNEAAGNRERRFSVLIPPEADYLAAYEGSMEKDITHFHSGDPLCAAKDETEQPLDSSAIRRASIAVASAYQTLAQGSTNLMRKSSLWDTYENAKIRGKHLQRKKWVQVVFEYAFYLVLLSFIYFVLVGRPLWNGAVWWLYWVVNTQFTVAGTWSITIGLAIIYAYAPLLILFEKEPPMPDKQDLAEAGHAAEAADTALLIPCYKAANIIGPTLVAAKKIFPTEHIFVVANGNSPVPLDNTEEICRQHGVNHVWSPVGSKIVAQYVGCYAAKRFANVLLIDDDCALPPNFPIVSDQLKGKVMCIGYTIKSVGPESSKGTLCQQAQDLEYKISGLQRALAGKIGSATFPHGAISLWNTAFLIDTFRTHPGYDETHTKFHLNPFAGFRHRFSVSEDWFFGHAARKLGSRITMCSAIFVETETPSAVLFSSGGARGGFGEMTIFKQRFYRWNFFFVNGIFYNMAYILGSWKLGFWELGAKLFVFQEVYETLLYLLAPFVLPISLIVRPAFCGYLLAGTLGLYFLNVTIFNEVHLRRRNERVGWVCVYLYYTPYKILLTGINILSCYYALYKYAKYFAKRHPKIIEDEKAIEVVLRLEETSRPADGTDANGRRFTVAAIGSRLSSDHRRPTVALTSIATGNNVMIPPATEQRKSSEVRRFSGTSSDTATGDNVDLVVPTRTITNPQYLPHLEAIEETLPGLRLSPMSSRESRYFS